ncbi:TonB-dependent hemoglobin/transferrin/lactoferrin family receptor [Tateyamaria omphalii]|uniref:TonB-dependent hemoglobin/transferrin/lactoferrin family receptor n=1 Tax=Tateyamaria omphalii TaxID=299262 RepID=UPI001C991F6E|nr:TonB-dependent hemoglobin/transferrin/lactoferrin family receptor [Tateyamaria omphalii]MBY5935579.1 TonB-dependent hemoglobin/transferrin/lactoferrin family receptor [Tateyamaria omphalii]
MQKCILGGVAMLAAGATTVQAQDDPVELPPLILGTALRDDRNIRDIPVAASVAEGGELQQRQADTVEELIGDVPGVSIEGGPRGVAQEINIRGFQDEQVVLRFDRGRLNFNRAHSGRFFFDPDIVERVEVVRGGGSTLFGSGAIGGVVAVETKDVEDLLLPGQTTGARVRLGYSDNGEIWSPSTTIYGDYGNFDALAFFGGREFGASLQDGNGDNILRSEVDTLNGLLKLGFEPTEDQRFELNLSYYEDDGLVPPNANTTADLNPVTGNDSERSAEIFTYRLSWDWNPEGSDLVDLSVLFYGNTLEIQDDRIRDGRADFTEYDTFGLEVTNRSKFDVGVPVELVYGIEAYRDEQAGTRSGAPRVQFPDAEATTVGVFAEATFGITDRLDLIAGVRFDQYDRDVDDPTLADADDDFFSPRIGFSFRPNENWQIFGNVARAYRAPTLTELYNDGVHFSYGEDRGIEFTNNFVPTPDLEPEESTQVELGARFERANMFRPGDSLRFSANAYYADVKNFIDSVVTEPDFIGAVTPPFSTIAGTSFQRNIDAELYGFEAELDYDAGWWFGGLALTLPEGEAKNGEQLGSIPQPRLTATLGYRPTSEWTVGARATFAGDQNDFPETGRAGEAYTVVDLFGSWAPEQGLFENAVFRAGIDNVFDEQYVIYPNELPQAGRSIKLSASFQF